MPIVSNDETAIVTRAPATTRRIPTHSTSAAANGAPIPKQSRFRETARPIVSWLQSNSSCRGTSRIPAVARKPAAITSATKPAAATCHATCTRLLRTGPTLADYGHILLFVVTVTELEPVASPCVCATLRRATRAVARLYDDALDPSGLRTTQFSILARLEAEGPFALGRLAARLGMDRRTLAHELGPLVRAGLVDEARGADRRRRMLSLSAAGAARLEAARPAWRATQRTLRAELGRDRTDGLLEELRAVAAVASALMRDGAATS
jgi:DNA-binding MarR family transcriptional regulator